jgi:hypothetical protein
MLTTIDIENGVITFYRIDGPSVPNKRIDLGQQIVRISCGLDHFSGVSS